MISLLAYKIIYLSIIATSSFFVFYILKRNSKNNFYKYYALLNASTVIWAFGRLQLLFNYDAETALVWARFLYFGSVLIYVFYLHTILIFLGKEKQRRGVLIFFYLNAILLAGVNLVDIFFGTNLLIKDAVPKMFFPYYEVPGPFYLLQLLSNIIIPFYAIIEMLLVYRDFRGLRKGQLRYVIFSTIFGLIGGGTILFLVYDINIEPIGVPLVLVKFLTMTYAISRYRLMEVRHFVSRSSIFLLLIFIIGSTFVILSDFSALLLSSYLNIQSPWFSGFFVGFIIVIFFEPLKKILEKITNKFLFVKKYNPSILLSEVTSIFLSVIDLDDLLNAFINKLKEVFYFDKFAFILLDNNDKFKIVKQEGFDLNHVNKFIIGKEKFLSVYFSGNKNIWVIPELKAAYNFGDYIPKNKEILFGLYELDINLVVPLFVKDKIIGLMILGDKKSQDFYTNEDLGVITISVGQLSIAIENSKLYEKEKEFNKKLKAEVKKAVYKLEQANKELQRLDDAKSEFLSIASHQLRTPTTIIKGYISMMQEGSFGKVSKLVKQNLDKVYLATERLLNLIENLLDISRIESGRLEFNMVKVNLIKTANELKEEFSKKVGEKNIKLLVYAPDNLPEVTADVLKIKEVASNLVDNAVKYTKEGEISLNLHQEGSSVVFSVIDTGIGMSSEEIGRLFNKFVRGDNMSTIHPEGNGLGLYFARVVIENMGGRIWAESAGKGQGSKFCFSLPLADKKKAIKIKS